MNTRRVPRLFARFAPAARSLLMPIPRHKRWADLEHRPINRRTGASPGGRRKNPSAILPLQGKRQLPFLLVRGKRNRDKLRCIVLLNVWELTLIFWLAHWRNC